MMKKLLSLSCLLIVTLNSLAAPNATTPILQAAATPTIPTTLSPPQPANNNAGTINASNTANAPKDPNAPNVDLAQSLSQTQNNEVRWLTSNRGPFLSLYTADKTGNQFGTVILLHGNGHHPDWPGIIHTLRTQLPEIGWSTLSIAVPNYEYEPTPPGGAPVPIAITADTYTTAAPLIPVLTQRIIQSLPLIQEPNKPIIMVAEGVSAHWLLAAYNTLIDPRFQGIILVTAQNAPDGPAIDFNQLLQQPSRRIFLDITSKQNFNFAQAQARDVTARRTRSDRYQLMVITGSLTDPISPLFLKQVRGWLRRQFERK